MSRVFSMTVVAWVFVALSCGGDEAPPAVADASPDAPSPPDAAPPITVTEVSCTRANVALTVSIQEPQPYKFVFAPDPGAAVPSIPAGSIVKFAMIRNHNAVSGTPATGPDDRFLAPNAFDTCFQFDTPGTYPFYCAPHSEEAKLTVTAN